MINELRSAKYRGVIKAAYKTVFSVARVRENNFSQRVILAVAHEYIARHSLTPTPALRYKSCRVK